MNTHQQSIVTRVAKYVRQRFLAEGTGHDWYHIERVFKLSRRIAKQEGGDLYVVSLGSLLHDIADSKFHHGDFTIGGKITRRLLKRFGVDAHAVEKVAYIVDHISFKKTGRKKNMQTLEGKIVQDADRLDALGAIGIARAFAYGGFRRRPIFNPAVQPNKKMTIVQAKAGESTIHHFYEKVLHLQKLMNTKTGRRLAKQGNAFIEIYLKQFFREWNGRG
jgi:uncharacterized protein